MAFSLSGFKYLFIIIFVVGITWQVQGQTISVNDTYAQEIARIQQVLGQDSSIASFAIRPILPFEDSILNLLKSSKNLFGNSNYYSPEIEFKALPFNFLSEYNNSRPFGYNNGSLLPNRGFQEAISGGFYLRVGPLTIQAKPEFVYSQNKPFATFADVQANNNSQQLLDAYFHTVNGIDAPERFGKGDLSKLYPGQSKATLNLGKLEIGASTENLWWGPGVKNSIMMSNSAPGFLHWTINTNAPVSTSIGSFEWQMIGGYLKQSGYPPTANAKLVYGDNLYIPKPHVTRYLSAFTLNWQPKWMRGFFIGLSEYDYLNIDSAYKSYGLLKKLFPVFTGSSNRANAITSTQNGDGQDFAFSINMRQVFEKEKAEIYFEWARNDNWASLTDLLQEPEHSSAYTLGGRKLYDVAAQSYIQVKFELTHLQDPPTYLLRDEPSWYVHLQAPQDGYTNDGRYIGAGIGPGSNSFMLGLSYLHQQNAFGFQFERIVHNNDLYYSAFAGTNTFNLHWVDLANTFYYNLKSGNILISSELTPVYTLNYEYKQGASYNLHARISMTYYFN